MLAGSLSSPLVCKEIFLAHRASEKNLLEHKRAGDTVMYAAYIGYGFILFATGFSGAYLIAVFKKGTSIAT